MKKSLPKLEKELKRLAGAIFKYLKIGNSSVNVFLVTNSEMEKIRQELVERPDFKGREAKKIKKEKYVNVLSFPEDDSFPKPASGKKNLGEIYINKDMTGGDLDQTAYLLVHGLLHLLGYEHQGKRDTMDMEKLEKQLFLAILD